MEPRRNPEVPASGARVPPTNHGADPWPTGSLTLASTPYRLRHSGTRSATPKSEDCVYGSHRTPPRPTTCVYRHDGQRRRFRLGRHGELTIAGARKLARAKLGQVANGTDVQAERKAARAQAEKDKATTLGGFLERHYWPHVEAEHKRGDLTRSIIEREFGHLLAKQLTDITPLVMTRWRRDRLADGIDASTLNRARGALSGVLSRAVEWGYLNKHPFANRQFKRLCEDTRPKVRYLSNEEERRFRQALRDRDDRVRAERLNSIQWHRARRLEPLPEFTGRFVDHLEPLLLTLRLTGMRPAEAFSLDWSDVDLDGRRLTVAGVTTKTKQTRHIPLSEELHGILKDWAQQTGTEGLVFPSPAGGKLVSITKGWSNIRDVAGLRDFRLYDLRHHADNRIMPSGAAKTRPVALGR